MSRRFRLGAAVSVAAVLSAAALAASPVRSAEGPAALQPGTRSVLFVANNWDGTADIVDPFTFKTLGRFNVVPDLQERMVEIYTNPVRLAYYHAIRQFVGEGNDQFADDMFSSHDGRYVYVSRPSLADVVAISLADNSIAWRFRMEGQRSDHMAISADGRRLLVSDSTAKKVHELDTATGTKVGEFASGDSPHENNYSADGKRVFHASIGLVYTPADQPFMDSTKGERYFQVVEVGTNKILKRLEVGKIMAEHGYPDMSSAVRPMAIAPDEKVAYLQLSFLHGFVVWDLEGDKPIRVVDLPKEGESTYLPREGYLLDSAHHGLAINPAGTKLCAAGTMSDYAAIVSTRDYSFKTISPIKKPYWSTNSGDGRYCFISASGADEVVVVDYEGEREVARIPVGDHPQRMRMGVIREEFVGGWLRAAGASRTPKRVADLQIRSARVVAGRLRLSLAVRRGATGRLRVLYDAGGQRRSFLVRIPSSGRRTVSLGLTARQRRAPTGAVKVVYLGDRRHTRDSARIRTGRIDPRLRVRARVDSKGRLQVVGKVARRARGSVRVRLGYVGSGTRVRFLRYNARIRDGRWAVRAQLPTQAARDGGSMSIQYGGDASRRIRGHHVLLRLRP